MCDPARDSAFLGLNRCLLRVSRTARKFASPKFLARSSLNLFYLSIRLNVDIGGNTISPLAADSGRGNARAAHSLSHVTDLRASPKASIAVCHIPIQPIRQLIENTALMPSMFTSYNCLVRHEFLC